MKYLRCSVETEMVIENSLEGVVEGTSYYAKWEKYNT